MGRTKRKRNRNKDGYVAACLNSDPSIIALTQWMKVNGWRNENLSKLSLFKNTGRGVAACKNMGKSERLIEVPYELMITFTTLENSFLNEAILPDLHIKLQMHDLLSIYLVFEKHKGDKSKWKTYIDSLPVSSPPLPWLCSIEEIQKLPEDLRNVVQDRFRVFESSWERSRRSITTRWLCECCNIPGNRVLTLNSFTWAYVMVNTRGVYVDPDIVRGLSRYPPNNFAGILSDDPCMALCPYLDMFNHSNKAETNAELVKVNEKLIFRLTTLTPVERYAEIFISYGPHDNAKLLCEYGFFIPDDELDTVTMHFSEILEITRIPVNAKQYKFIRERHLDDALHVNISGLSFNMKAVLFVILYPDLRDWCSCIFSETYTPESVVKGQNLVKVMMEFKMSKCSGEFTKLVSEDSHLSSDSFKNILSYLQHRLSLMQRICNTIGKESNK